MDPPSPNPDTPRWRGVTRLALMVALFVGLTVAGAAWALDRSEVDVAAALAALTALPTWGVALLLVLSTSLLGAEMLRFRVAGHLLGERVRWRACFDATVANNFFSWLTPGSALGEPATIAVLGRRGVPWDVAGLIAYGKTITGMLFFTGLAFAMLGLGLGPSLAPIYLLPFLTATGVVVLFGGALVCGALWPERAISGVRRLRAWLGRLRILQGPRATRGLDALADNSARATERLGHFRQEGLRGLALLHLSHVLYYASFLGVLVTLAHLYGASAVATIPHAILYQCFTYFAPTPGGAGLSEATGEAFFGELLVAGDAVIVVLLYRSLTFYLHVLIGFLYLPVAGGVLALMRLAAHLGRADP